MIKISHDEGPQSWSSSCSSETSTAYVLERVDTAELLQCQEDRAGARSWRLPTKVQKQVIHQYNKPLNFAYSTVLDSELDHYST